MNQDQVFRYSCLQYILLRFPFELDNHGSCKLSYLYPSLMKTFNFPPKIPADFRHLDPYSLFYLPFLLGIIPAQKGNHMNKK